MEDITRAIEVLTTMVDIGMRYEVIVLGDPPDSHNDMVHYIQQQEKLMTLSTEYNDMVNTMMRTIDDPFRNALVECLECNNLCYMHCEEMEVPDVIAYRNKCMSNSRKHHRLTHVIEVLHNKHQHGKSALCTYIRNAYE